VLCAGGYRRVRRVAAARPPRPSRTAAGGVARGTATGGVARGRATGGVARGTAARGVARGTAARSLELPIFRTVHGIFSGEVSLHEAQGLLMERPLTLESGKPS